MNVTLKQQNIVDDKIELDIEIPFSEISKKYNTILKNYTDLVTLPGFRKGKAPVNMIKSKFNEDIQNETIEKLIPEAVDVAVKTNEIKTYGPPFMEPKEREKVVYSDNQAINLKVSYHRPPECNIKSLDGLVIEDIKIKITDEDIENSKKDKLLQFAEKQEITDQWEVKDLLKVDVIFENESLKKYNLSDNPTRFEKPNVGAQPLFLNQLFNALHQLKAGEEKTLKFKFSNDVDQEELKDKEVSLTIKINQVVRMILPKITDEILKQINFTSEEELEKSIREELNNYCKEREDMHRNEEILKAVKANTEFTIPDIAMDYVLQDEWTQLVKRTFGGNPPDDQYQHAPQQWVDENRPRAKKQLEDQLIIQKIRDTLSIEVGEDEMTKEVEVYANNAKKDVKEYRRELIKSGQYSAIKNNLLVKKSLASLLEKAKVTKTTDTTFLELSQKKA